jgi:hypothetical protein
MIEFYKTGDIEGLTPGDEQRANKEKLIEESKREYWKSFVEASVGKINQLWRLGGKLDFWEEDWFPGYNLFLQDIHKAGYFIYQGEPARRNAHGLTQKRFIISLEPIAGMKEIYTKEEESNEHDE